jgi:hypothetical protein
VLTGALGNTPPKLTFEVTACSLGRQTGEGLARGTRRSWLGCYWSEVGLRSNGKLAGIRQLGVLRRIEYL